MINITDNIIFNQVGPELDQRVRSALALTANTLLDVYGVKNIDHIRVTTKSNSELTFSKFIITGTLKSDILFGKNYILNALAAYRAGGQAMTEAQFEIFTGCRYFVDLEFKRTYANSIKSGIGLFLLALHINQAITLPGTFIWPSNRSRGGGKGVAKAARGAPHSASRIICAGSELLSFVRSIDTELDAVQADEAFAAVGTDQNRVLWYSTYATRLLLATGWHSPEDVNVDDLLELRKAEKAGTERYIAVYKALLDSFQRKFGKRSNVQLNDWTEAIRPINETTKLKKFMESQFSPFSKPSIDAFYEVVATPASNATPERLEKLTAQPGLKFSIQSNAGDWLHLQNLYLSEVQKESYKHSIQALGLFNLYLFFYLPYWFDEHPGCKILFPSNPNLLVKSIFVTRINRLDQVPETFVSFMKARQKIHKIADSTAYSYLKQVQVFFDFLVQHSDELPNCCKFNTQPLSKRDFPLTPRSIGTPKPRFPNRLFISFINYISAVKGYFDSINQKILEGELEDPIKQYQIVKFSGFIDTQRIDSIFGIPVPKFLTGIEQGNREIFIRYMPNLVNLCWYRLKDGRFLRLFRPHVLNQILVALYTGLRHNHIQWLDATTFNKFVNEEDIDFSKLFVNTDKTTKRPWIVDVNIEVIKILTMQLKWRNLIAEPGFDDEHYYNNNKNTSYQKFKPLFSYGTNGLPHHDQAYALAWNDLISTFEVHIDTIIGHDKHRYALSKLRPPGVDFNDLSEKEKLASYKPSPDRKNVCLLNVKTRFTPHITRVSVVSEYIMYLPATLIGKYITGQTAATVMHYVRTDRDELERLQVTQGREICRRANERQIDEFVNGIAAGEARYIKPDLINSNLAKSAKKDLSQTLARYGCLSISYFDADKKDGIDILKEKGIAQAALNKTEICPYGNQCPQDVVIVLKGLRRCALCPYAVRSIDHLPALGAKERQVADVLGDLHNKIMYGCDKYTEEELDQLEGERQKLGEEYAGWKLCIEILVTQHQRVLSGESTRKWVVEKPEIIEQDLRRIPFPTSETQYLLTRLQECVAYPGFQSPLMNTLYEILKLRLLALDPSRKHESLLFKTSIEPAAECAGLIRSIAEAHKLSAQDFERILEQETSMAALRGHSSAFPFELLLETADHKIMGKENE